MNPNKIIILVVLAVASISASARPTRNAELAQKKYSTWFQIEIDGGAFLNNDYSTLGGRREFENFFATVNGFVSSHISLGFGAGLTHIAAMFGAGQGFADAACLAVLKQYALFFPVMVFCAMPVLPAIRRRTEGGRAAAALDVAGTVAAVLVAVASLAMLVGQSYNPFIYFRF